MAEPTLSVEELARYQRQIGPGVLSEDDQLRLKRSTVFISRVGGMGGPAAMALAMAGVGRIIFAHGGKLDLADLNRQVLGCQRGLGEPRAGQFADCLRRMNPLVTVDAIDREPDDTEAVELARRADLVIAAAPTFAERFRLNRAAVACGVPMIDAAQWGMTGTLIAIQPRVTACLRCVYPEDPPFEEMFPVVGAISGALGNLAALEAIKILSGAGRPVFGSLLLIDGYRGHESRLQLRRDPACPCCGSQTTPLARERERGTG
jgi:molybdopterin/thiamine biosynthesis adenylyltransferase